MAAFAPVMTGDAATLQADYVPLTPFREPLPSQPAVVALPVPEPYGARNLSAMAMEKSLPDAVGAFIDWVVNASGWAVHGNRECQSACQSRIPPSPYKRAKKGKTSKRFLKKLL